MVLAMAVAMALKATTLHLWRLESATMNLVVMINLTNCFNVLKLGNETGTARRDCGFFVSGNHGSVLPDGSLKVNLQWTWGK